MGLFRKKDKDTVYDPDDERLDFRILYMTSYYHRPARPARRRWWRRAVGGLLLLAGLIVACLLLSELLRML